MSHLLLLDCPAAAAAIPAAAVPAAASPALYRGPLQTAFRQTPPATPVTLDIAVRAPFLSCSHSRRQTFAAAQRLLAGLYSLAHSVAVAAKRDSLVDFRIVFLSERAANTAETNEWAFGPVVSLKKLAGCGRAWKIITIALSPGNDANSLGAQFLAIRGDKVGFETTVFRCELDHPDHESPVAEPEIEDAVLPSLPEHSIVVVGGTFDHLHPGHKHLLTMTCFLISPGSPSARLVIGLTGQKLLENKKHREHLAGWESRADSVEHFLRGILEFSPPFHKTPEEQEEQEQDPTAAASTPQTPTTPRSRTTVLAAGDKSRLTIESVEINDLFGPTITNQTITALVASRETQSGAKTVNEERVKKGWEELEVFVVEVLEEEGGGGKMSSTELRRREGGSGKL